MLIQPRDDCNTIIKETWEMNPEISSYEYKDIYGNRCQRFTIPKDENSIIYNVEIEIKNPLDEVDESQKQIPVQDLPNDVLIYTLSSRYCYSDELINIAWGLFGQIKPGWERIKAICDWVNTNIKFKYGSSDTNTTAIDVYNKREGVCRDMSHLAITFCRAFNVPARYVFGYFLDIEADDIMDFHAWIEVFMGKWWTFDASYNKPRIGRIIVGIGRDAADVSMSTTYGKVKLEKLTVWTEQI
jgi:transglutaminase-like putative cysteine protease